MNFILKNKGFTLIEIMVAITISMGIVLLVSYSLKFFINSWNKTKEIFLVNQKYLFINSLLEQEYHSIIPFKYNGKIFFKGNSEYTVFITQDSGTIYTGINEVGYYFDKNKKSLKVCFESLNKEENIIDYEVLKEEGACIDFENIEQLAFKYKITENSDETDEIDGKIPVRLTASINFIVDQDNIMEKQININYYE